MFVIIQKGGTMLYDVTHDEALFTDDIEEAIHYQTSTGAWKDIFYYNLLRVDVKEV